MGKKIEFFDLKNQFIFYASYHNHPVNVFIHLFCIWQLLWTGLALFQYGPSLGSLTDFLPIHHPVLQYAQVNPSLLVTCIYVMAYLCMDAVAGGLASMLIIVLYLATSHLVNNVTQVGGYPLWQVLLAYHIIMWIAQFIGHGVFEKRAPALLDSWDQAFITAPLFVLLEIMFYFGYRRQFYNDCMIQVEKNIAEFRKNKQG